jgi:hypothetical protein
VIVAHASAAHHQQRIGIELPSYAAGSDLKIQLVFSLASACIQLGVSLLSATNVMHFCGWCETWRDIRVL